MTTASIDELLQHEEEPPPRERTGRRTPAGWVVRMLLVSLALSVVTVLVLRGYGYALPYTVVFTGFLALLLLRRALRSLPPPVRPRLVGRRLYRPDDPDSWSTPDGIAVALTRWETRLDWSRTDRDRFVRIAQGPMADIVDERLRQRHGLTRRSDPDRARAIMGEALWQFLLTPARRTPSPRELAALLDAMERIS